jgi:hypothetical protein
MMKNGKILFLTLILSISLADTKLFSMDKNAKALRDIIIQLALSENPKEMLQKLHTRETSLLGKIQEAIINNPIKVDNLAIKNLKQPKKHALHLREGVENGYCLSGYKFQLNPSNKLIEVINKETGEQFSLVGCEYEEDCCIEFYKSIDLLLASKKPGVLTIWDINNTTSPLLLKINSHKPFKLSKCHRFLIDCFGYVIDIKTLLAIKDLINNTESSK